MGFSVHWNSREGSWGSEKALGLQTPKSQPFLMHRVLPESARWLLTRGRVEEAKKLIQKVAAVNKRKLSPELLSQVLPVGWVQPCP